MIKIDLNRDWRISEDPALNAEYCIAAEGMSVDLPFDYLTAVNRDFSSSGGEFNGYYASKSIAMYKELPADIAADANILLDISGAGGAAEVFLNGARLGSVLGAYHHQFNLTGLLLSSANILKIVAANYTDSGSYQALGICGGVSLLVSGSSLYIPADGVFVKTNSVDGPAKLTASVEVANESDEEQIFLLKVEVLNKNGKRVVKKLRKIKLKAGVRKAFDLNMRMSRHYDWSSYDPYLYTVKAAIAYAFDEETEVIDSASVPFGIRTFTFGGKVFKLNNQPLKLKGAVMAHDNGILGGISELSVEMYKLGKIKELGFNAVRYIGCPSDAALTALDKLGLAAVVDIFPSLSSGRFINDGHLNYAASWQKTVEMTVKALRSHPCVVVYSIADDAEESYGRGEGASAAEKITALIKKFDNTRPVTANVKERVPSRYETDLYGLKVAKNSPDFDAAAINAARNIDLFRTLTQDYLDKVDFAGYSDLHQRFAVDTDRSILGLKAKMEELYDAFEETDKNTNVLGNFVFAGTDFIGNTEKPEGSPSTFKGGLLDKTFRIKDAASYASIVLNRKNSTYIVVQDPEEIEIDETALFDPETAASLWNWPRHIGKPVNVRVYTNGDIVALYLDGKVIGRKLAGKFNRYYADFKLNYYPGKLEAISFLKGAEASRGVLETASAPKALKMFCSSKVVKEGDLVFIDVCVTDKEGRKVSFAKRDVLITVEGEGSLVAFGNGDPENFNSVSTNEQQVFDGAATAIVRAGGAGKIFVKVVSEGLLSNKTAIRVK